MHPIPVSVVLRHVLWMDWQIGCPCFAFALAFAFAPAYFAAAFPIDLTLVRTLFADACVTLMVVMVDRLSLFCLPLLLVVLVLLRLMVSGAVTTYVV